MVDLNEMSRKLLDKINENDRLQGKLSLAQQKFADAARDNDKKRAEDARLEYSTLMDALFDLNFDTIRMAEELKRETANSLFRR